MHRRQPAPDIRLDLHYLPVHTTDRNRMRPPQRHQNASTKCSTEGTPSRPINTATTSKRTLDHDRPESVSQCIANTRIRRCFANVTDSAGLPYPAPERVFTSTNTIRSPDVATTSNSPYRQRQLRSTISKPASIRNSTATSSPRAPNAIFLAIAAPTTHTPRPPIRNASQPPPSTHHHKTKPSENNLFTTRNLWNSAARHTNGDPKPDNFLKSATSWTKVQ